MLLIDSVILFLWTHADFLPYHIAVRVVVKHRLLIVRLWRLWFITHRGQMLFRFAGTAFDVPHLLVVATGLLALFAGRRLFHVYHLFLSSGFGFLFQHRFGSLCLRAFDIHGLRIFFGFVIVCFVLVLRWWRWRRRRWWSFQTVFTFLTFCLSGFFQLLQFLCTGLFLLFSWTVFSFHASLVVLFCVVCLLFRFIVATVVFIVAHVCGSEISEFQ